MKLSPVQRQVLKILVNGGSIRSEPFHGVDVHDSEGRQAMHSSYLTLDALERKGLVTKVKVEKDGAFYYRTHVISDAGREVMK